MELLFSDYHQALKANCIVSLQEGRWNLEPQHVLSYVQWNIPLGVVFYLRLSQRKHLLCIALEYQTCYRRIATRMLSLS